MCVNQKHTQLKTGVEEKKNFYLNETTKGQRFGVKFQTVCNVKATQIKA